MKKFKGQVYRNAIQELENSLGYACCALSKSTKKISGYSERFSRFLRGEHYQGVWTLSRNYETGKNDAEYMSYTKLGRLTREIALELAAHLEETGEMNRILKGK